MMLSQPDNMGSAWRQGCTLKNEMFGSLLVVGEYKDLSDCCRIALYTHAMMPAMANIKSHDMARKGLDWRLRTKDWKVKLNNAQNSATCGIVTTEKWQGSEDSCERKRTWVALA